MFELFACSAAVALFAALWLAVYKLGALDWTTDASLVKASQGLSAAHLALDGEMHGAAMRLSPVRTVRTVRAAKTPLFGALAGQARLSVPV
jgi:hypothetical protein